MLMQSLKPLAIVLVSTGFVLASATLQAQVVNGSLNGSIANGAVPNGWSIVNETPDTMNENNNIGVTGLQDFSATPSVSPDGGTWVGIGSNTGFTEAFGQTLTGLTLGNTYKVSWYTANFGFETLGYNNANSVNVLIDGTSIGTGAVHAVGTSWYQESVSFTAAALTANLSFQLASDAKSYLSVDGIAIAPVPEPATWALMFAGLGLVGKRSTTRRLKEVVSC